jgi:hypothetical protein
MNFDELAYFAMMSLVGLSILTVSVGFTVRVFLGPVLRDVAERFASRPTRDDQALVTRLDQLDDRLASLESGLDRIETAQDFDRRLSAVDTSRSETA